MSLYRENLFLWGGVLVGARAGNFPLKWKELMDSAGDTETFFSGANGTLTTKIKTKLERRWNVAHGKYRLQEKFVSDAATVSSYEK